MTPSAHRDTFARDHLPDPFAWPVLLLDGPDTRYPDRLNVAAALLDAAVAEGHGESPALRSDAGLYTYLEVQARVDRIAHTLTGPMGLVPGNRVLLRGANHPSLAICWLAVVKAGLIAVATMPQLRAAELTPIIDKAQVTAALCDASLIDELRSAQALTPRLKTVMVYNAPAQWTGPESTLDPLAATTGAPFQACDTAADDVALIAFTSGTTGQPKGTMHFHRDVLAMCDLFPRHVLRPGPQDIFCGTPPLAFTFGLGGLLCFPLRYGASVLLLERATPDTLLAAIQLHKASICFTAPTFFRQMAGLAGRYDLSSLRKCVSAGEALPDATRQLWKSVTGIELIDGIGSTEMIHIFISAREEDVRRGSIGKVVPGYEARVVDEHLRPVPAGTIGWLAVRGPTGCRYLDDPRQAEYVRDGWNLTGDTFTRDDDGYFFYQARSDDMIISSGYNIAGPEVEAALLAHEAVAECGVIGVPDEARGQIVKAFVVPRPGELDKAGGETALAKNLQDWVKSTIAPYKYPRAIEFRDSLPRTETGKLQRFRLRSAPPAP
ncbi:MAG: AMP-binding protein [Burkholderiaceae bacterium]|nr:AMP-binding protein [Burkholderiaceae bacterium]